MENDIIEVAPDTKTICCDGGQDSLDHPAVYYSFDDNNKIVCIYCGKTFVKKENYLCMMNLGDSKEFAQCVVNNTMIWEEPN